MHIIRYDSRVLLDLKRIDASVKEKIRNSIESKLATEPEIFGKPLRRSLAGFRVLRVGDYRVVFLLKGGVVLILIIGNREYIYKEAQKRLRDFAV